MFKFFDNLTGRQKLFGFVFLSILISILLIFFTKGLLDTIAITILVVIILFVTRNIWLPEDYGRTRIRKYSLWIVLTVATSYPLWNEYMNSLLRLIKKEVPFLEGIQIPSATPSTVVLIFVLLGISVVNYFMRDKTAMGIHAKPIDREFPEKNYKQRLMAFCRILGKDLDEINRETNWSEEYFTPLDAEVEIHSKNKKLKKITDLLSAIRKNKKTKAFLLLGDPGSGKSVALRKLCRELLDEVEKTGKVPIYINLREWEIEGKWDEENPPTVPQLNDFVLRNLKNRGDVFSSEFLEKYFKKMFDAGRLFIILDSFDEIPAVLDVDESSWLIDKLSSVIYTFLAGAHDSRGILASRIFRKPTQNFDAKTTLEIRPFTEEKIIQRFKKAFDYDKTLERLIFKDRQEFVPIARNPFTAALILDYAQKHNFNLPENQAELYSS